MTRKQRARRATNATARSKPRARLTIYVLGNEDVPEDSLAPRVARLLKGEFAGADARVRFVFPRDPLELASLPSSATRAKRERGGSGERVFVLDAARGVDRVRVVDAADFAPRTATRSVTAHDLDYAFLARLTRALGRATPRVIAIPWRASEREAARGVARVLARLLERANAPNVPPRARELDALPAARKARGRAAVRVV